MSGDLHVFGKFLKLNPPISGSNILVFGKKKTPTQRSLDI